MKIRQGFVSNSSSSSFTLFVKKAAYDAALPLLSKPARACVEYCAEQQAMGNDLFVVVHEHSDQGGEGTLTCAVSECDYGDDEESEEQFYEGLHRLEEILKKQFPGTFLSHSV